MKTKLATLMAEETIVKSVAMETIHIKAGVMSPVTFFVTTCVSLPEFMRRMSGSISVRKGETHYQKSVDIKKEGIGNCETSSQF